MIPTRGAVPAEALTSAGVGAITATVVADSATNPEVEATQKAGASGDG